MNRNFGTLLTGSLLFGLGVGVYEFALPYYLDSVGISVPRMGVIYAIGAVGIYVVRMYAGHLSDRFGRKSMYSFAVLLAGLATAITPTTAIMWLQTLFKSAYEAGAMIFDSMYQLCLHDDSRRKYVNRVGKVRGLQALAAAMATLFAGIMLGRELYTSAFHVAAVALFLSVLVFAVGYRASNDTDRHVAPPSAPSPLQLLRVNLPRPLVVLMVSGFIFTVGLSISHCFVMQLFWERQFEVSRADIGILLMLHRFTMAVPLLLLSWPARRRLKAVFIVFLTLEGLALIASGLIGNFLVAAAVWLTHDLIGAGVWLPAQSALIQRYSREESRGRDVSQVFAISSLGWIFGPLIAGAVFEHWYGGPFVLSGAVMVLAACVLVLLPPDDSAASDEPAHSVSPGRDVRAGECPQSPARS